MFHKLFKNIYAFILGEELPQVLQCLNRIPWTALIFPLFSLQLVFYQSIELPRKCQLNLIKEIMFIWNILWTMSLWIFLLEQISLVFFPYNLWPLVSIQLYTMQSLSNTRSALRVVTGGRLISILDEGKYSYGHFVWFWEVACCFLTDGNYVIRCLCSRLLYLHKCAKTFFLQRALEVVFVKSGTKEVTTMFTVHVKYTVSLIKSCFVWFMVMFIYMYELCSI